MILTSVTLLELKLHYYLFLINLIVCFISILGMFILANEFIYFFICNELFIFSIILNLLLLGNIYDDLVPQVFVFFILATSSAEIVIGLSVIVNFYRILNFTYSSDDSLAYKFKLI